MSHFDQPAKKIIIACYAYLCFYGFLRWQYLKIGKFFSKCVMRHTKYFYYSNYSFDGKILLDIETHAMYLQTLFSNWTLKLAKVLSASCQHTWLLRFFSRQNILVLGVIDLRILTKLRMGNGDEIKEALSESQKEAINKGR